ncbi:MAG: glycerol-3-phosphate 1-O-acyltransferase PlsY [Holosporaceae bacterium]|nr:glycerol-3-phosphate 1-O-acyltransferase PlsY [Holosporaceae bacterium]
MRVMQNFYPIFAYLFGAIPFGPIFSHMFGNGKLRESGSKNVGATNAFRTQGKAIGIMTLLFDFIKGFIPCFFFKTECNCLNLLILVAPVLGHIFSIWLKFKGGKGIATYFGVLCALSPLVCLGTALMWSIVFIITKISAVAGLVSIVSSLIIFNYAGTALYLDFINQLYALIGMVVLIIIRHSENIKRLMKKEQRT